MQISVIVPVRNEENSIRELLDALLSQSYPPHEIVITDGGSVDNTPSIIQHYIDRRAPVRMIRSGPALPGRGRNLAAAAASCEWLAFIDAGVRPERDWLEKLQHQTVERPQADVIYGSYEPVTDTLFKECAAISYVPPPQEIEGVIIRPRSIASALVKKSVWQAVGGFPEQLRSAEDLLFMQKIEDQGFVLAYAPEARVHWQVQSGVWGTFKRFVVYAENNMSAGLWRRWQARIFFRYALLLATALPAFVIGWRWLAVTLLLWLIMLAARALLSVKRNSRSYPATWSRQLVRLVVLVPLIAVIDAAALVGTIKWLLTSKPTNSQRAVEVSHGG